MPSGLCCCCCFRKQKKEQRPRSEDTELTNETPTLKLNAIEELKLKLAHRESETAEMIPDNNRGTATPPSTPLLSEEGLIIPRKPPNPVRENPERQNLHKELLFNQKIGKNVLNQKTELQKALEKHKENLLRKELENQVASTTPELEKVIADRARRLQEGTNENKNEEDKSINPEFLQARLKLRSKDAK